MNIGQRVKNILVRLSVTLAIILVSWTVLTLWVERSGPSSHWNFEGRDRAKRVLIVFDPDPIYNLDEQVCLAVGKALWEADVAATVVTVAATDSLDLKAFDGFVLCANTYNWAPDWAVVGFIKSTEAISGKPVMAITVGSGSTQQSQQKLEKLVREKGGVVLRSQALWLMRPNDENRLKDNNVDVAVSLAHDAGLQLAAQLSKFSLQSANQP
jgi:hypothetical protein